MTTTIDPAPLKPHAGKTLTVSYSPSLKNTELLQLYAREWANRNGVSVEVRHGGNGPADIEIVSPAEMPELAERKVLAPVPPAILGRDHSYRWETLFPMHSKIIAAWGPVVYGIPLMGEGRVLVYREDRLAAAKLHVPATWEEYVKAAECF